MQFKSEKALMQLLKEGLVVTMRNTNYDVGQKIKINKKYDAIIVTKTLNTRIIRKDLWDASGFDSLEEWEEEAKRLHKGKLPKFIYAVALEPAFSEVVEKHERGGKDEQQT